MVGDVGFLFGCVHEINFLENACVPYTIIRMCRMDSPLDFYGFVWGRLEYESRS